MEELMRSMLLALSKSGWANHLARRYGLRMGAGRFVAGVTVDEALAQVRLLNESGLLATMDHLGEFVKNELEAHDAAEYGLRALDAIAVQKAQAHLSIKLTQLGLDLNPEATEGRVREIVGRAKGYGNFVRVDMEDFSHCKSTLDLVQRLRSEFDNVGTVVQAYLYRSLEDARRLTERGVPLRIVKGAYREPKEVAYPEKADVDANYRRIVEVCLRSGTHTAIATHDEKLIAFAREFIETNQIPRNRYEFQMLYGIRPGFQRELARAGHTVRIYVPFGTDWYGYYMRRLAERPANVGFVLRSAWRR